MDSNLLTIIGISLVALFFGYFFGLFEGRGQGYKRRKKEEAAEAPAEAAPQSTPAPAPAPAPREKNLLRLSLDSNQAPGLELDGNPVAAPNLSPEQRKRLIDLMVVMRPWIDGTAAPKPVMPPASVPAPAAVAPVTPRPVVSPSSVAAPVPGSTARPTAEPGAPTTMVGQIDAILQARITGTPLASRGIRLMESGQGGASIFVGLDRYAGVSDVPDPEVQAAIKAAIAEWEAKYTPS